MRPFTRTQASHCIDCRTFSKTYGILRIVPAAAAMHATRSISLSMVVSYTQGLSLLPQKRNPWALNQVTWLAKRSIHGYRYIALRMFGLGNHAQHLWYGMEFRHVDSTYLDGHVQEQRPKMSVTLSQKD